jgi:hypothetical protein
MRRILKRLETLERAADKEIFADALPYAIAYYLGGAKHASEVLLGYARALGYKDLDEFCEGVADFLRQPSHAVNKFSGLRARALRAQCKLLAKFGYNPRRASSAALADVPYRIVRTLPEEWRAMIKSTRRESYEAEARANPLLKEAMKLAEEC